MKPFPSSIGRTPVFTDAPNICKPIMLGEIVTKIESLPSMPEVASYLMRIHDDDIDLNHAIKLMSYDQNLTAKVLRFANSAYVGSRSTTRNVPQAIQLIGLRALRDIISMNTVSTVFSPMQCPQFNLPLFWRHSLAAASVASNLAQLLNTARGTAFTAGLLHDIGRMVLACSIPHAYSEVLQYQESHNCSVMDAEIAVIDLDHIQAGVALGHHWKLGESLVYAISFHHDAPLAFDFDDPLPGIVFLANMIAHTVDFEKEDMEPVTNEIFNAWNEIGLSGKDYGKLIQATRLDYKKAISILHI